MFSWPLLTNTLPFERNYCRKLIGGKFFIKGYAAAAGGTGNVTAAGDFLSVRDKDGHGSHTSSTAGGNFVPGTYSNFPPILFPRLGGSSSACLLVCNICVVSPFYNAKTSDSICTSAVHASCLFIFYHNSMCKCVCFDNQQTNQVQMCLDKQMGLPREVLRTQGLQHIKCVGQILMVEVDVLIVMSWQRWTKQFMMEWTS
jgi:hypothetical protein